MSLRLQKQIDALKADRDADRKRLAALEKELLTVEKVKKQLHDIIINVLEQNLEIQIDNDITGKKILEGLQNGEQ